jgi:AAA+ ATPase superfamily predicted ATPase
MIKVNPFKPNNPVPPVMFAGRRNEIEKLKQGLYQTKHNQPNNFLITGERGIGKTSLMMILKDFSSGRLENIDYEKLNFLTINITISEKTTLLGFFKLIRQNIERQLSDVEPLKAFVSHLWDFLQRVTVMDSKIDSLPVTEDTDLLIDNLAYSLSKICQRITNPEKDENKKDGIIFIIDEADKACDELHIGYFFKVITELLQQHGCENIMFIVAGLPEISEKLLKSHESSLRIFHNVNIKELSEEDRYKVIDKCIQQGNLINKETPTSITTEAKGLISLFSEGYPHFIQQLGHSAFDQNSDGQISKSDVMQSVVKDGGAIDEIGKRYYASAFYSKIQSDEYRQVLQIMAGNWNEWIDKKTIQNGFTGTPKTLTNALAALTDRKIILKNPSVKGQYKLQEKAFALWIKLFTQKQGK